MVRRAAEEVVRARGMAEDRVQWHLDNWAEFMRHGRMPVDGYPTRASGGIVGRSSMEFDTMAHECVDMACARVVWALVLALPQRLQLAVNVTHGLTAAVYWVRGGVEESYLQARELIGTGLTRRGIP